MFASLKIRNFRIYWLGMFVSLIGSWIQIVAQSWLVFDLTNSSFLLGFVGFLGSIPVFIFSLFGGVFADRLDKRKILIITQSAFMVLAFLLALLTQFKLITPNQIMVIAVLNGIVMAFDAPSRQSVVADLVDKEHLLNAIALNSAAFNSSRMIGPALAGVFVASIGMSGCFYINGISFLAVILALLWIKINHEPRNAASSSAFQELKDGLKVIKNNRTMLILVSMVGISSLFGISYTILMPVFASQILHVGVKGLGVLMSSSGIGALAAALMLAALGDFKYKGKFLSFASIIFSLSVILFSLSKSYLFAIFTLVFVGWAAVTAIALINTILQTMVSDEYRGRVMSGFMFTFAGFMPFGNLLSGILSEHLGVSAAIMIGGIICAIFFTGIIILYPQIRKI